MNYFAALVLNGVTPTDWAVLGACFALAAATLIFIFYIALNKNQNYEDSRLDFNCNWNYNDFYKRIFSAGSKDDC